MKTNIITKSGLQIEAQSGFMPYFDNSNPSNGLVRYVGLRQRLEVYDGYQWMPLPDNTIEIGIDDKSKELFSWVEKK